MTHAPAVRVCGTALWGALLLAADPGAAQAPSGSESRIARVTVYPGEALIERVVKVRASQTVVELPCLPARLKPDSLRFDGDAGLELGAAVSRVRARAEVSACRVDEDDARLRELQRQLTQIEAEHAGHEAVLVYVRSLGGRGPDAVGQPAAMAQGLNAMAEALRRLAQEALVAQGQLAVRKAPIERELRERRAEIERLGTASGNVTSLSLPVRTASDQELRVRYLVEGPTWGPRYRARLDTDRQTVELERMAQVRQVTGEDWTGVDLSLSTGQPSASVEPARASAWEWRVLEPARLAAGLPDHAMAAMAPAPAPAAAAAPRSALDRPGFEPVKVQQGEFATEFVLPGRTDVSSRKEDLLLRLDKRPLSATLSWQANPRAEAVAYVLASVELPPGVWPGGPVMLERGQQGVGRSWLHGVAGAKVDLPFGRDELLHVQVVPEQRKQGSGGFVGNRTELRVERAYEVRNGRRGPVRLRVLESSPNSLDERIEVTRSFKPDTRVPEHEAAGVVAWEMDLPAGASQRFQAEYLVSHPKDLKASERR